MKKVLLVVFGLLVLGVGGLVGYVFGTGDRPKAERLSAAMMDVLPVSSEEFIKMMKALRAPGADCDAKEASTGKVLDRMKERQDAALALVRSEIAASGTADRYLFLWVLNQRMAEVRAKFEPVQEEVIGAARSFAAHCPQHARRTNEKMNAVMAAAQAGTAAVF
jgi:hypothetical protein